jgi:DNA-binding NarL/FixJ family response regulator
MSDAAAIDLLVLDDHAIVRQGVMLLLQQQPWITSCRGAASVEEAVQLMQQKPADVAVVDLSLKRQSGLDAIETLLQAWPTLPIVVLTMHADALHCQRALQRGALGFVAKDDASDELAEAVQRTLARQRYLSTSVRSHRLGHPDGAGHAQALAFEDTLALLTQRERQVLALIGRGWSAAEVAAELGRSVKTVEAHRNNLREKLGLKNNRQLLQLSARWAQLDGSE